MLLGFMPRSPSLRKGKWLFKTSSTSSKDHELLIYFPHVMVWPSCGWQCMTCVQMKETLGVFRKACLGVHILRYGAGVHLLIEGSCGLFCQTGDLLNYLLGMPLWRLYWISPSKAFSCLCCHVTIDRKMSCALCLVMSWLEARGNGTQRLFF